MTVFLFDVLLSFLIFLRLISVFGFQGTTLTVFISHSSVLLRLRTRNLWLLVLKSIQMLFASSSHIWKQAFICSSSRKTLEWRRRDSNSWPPACKAGALPTELHPHMGLSGLEPPTSRLSGVRSNQLSYKPIMCSHIGRLYESVKRLLFLTGDITLIYHSYILTFI